MLSFSFVRRPQAQSLQARQGAPAAALPALRHEMRQHRQQCWLGAAGMHTLTPVQFTLISWKGCSLRETSSYHGCFSFSLAAFSELQLC